LRLVAATRFGTVPDDPTGEMPDDGGCCRAGLFIEL
jgi:hypothetical protein